MQTLCPESGLQTAPNWPKIPKVTMTSQIIDMMSTSHFFDVVLFSLSSLVTGPSFISISSLVLELWPFSFIRDWPEIRKSEIPLSEFCPISGDWGELWILHLARMSLIECYGMLQNSKVTAFTVFELLRENQLGDWGVKLPSFPNKIRVELAALGIKKVFPCFVRVYTEFIFGPFNKPMALASFSALWKDQTLDLTLIKSWVGAAFCSGKEAELIWAKSRFFCWISSMENLFRRLCPARFGDLIYKHLNYNHTQRST